MPSDLLRSAYRGARILIADDEQINVHTLERILRRADYNHCIGVTNPAHVLEIFLEREPDLVLLDWHMGSTSGLEVIRSLRDRFSTADLPPIIVLTGDTDPSLRREALAAGAADFLAKPLDYTEVLLRIRNLLQIRMLRLDARQAHQRLETLVRERTALLERNIEELEELQQQIVRQERLRALGAMASGIAHDFNNVLTVVRGYSDLFANQPTLCGNPKKVEDCLKTIATVSRDAGEIVRRLREFHRPDGEIDENLEAVDLNRAVREAVGFSNPIWQRQTEVDGRTVQVQLKLHEVPLVSACAAELREVMMNLIFNSVDAMPKGGQITVRTGLEDNFVFFQVEDNGSGMTEETRRHCLEPFYTTKGERGTGLGLAVTYGIIRRHDGIIRVHSELNRGTEFTVLLPIAQITSLPDERLPQPPCPPPMRILLAEDQPSVRALICNTLRHDAHTVMVASDGYEALQMFRNGIYDLVITDLAMPRMNGDQLVDAIRLLNPAQPIIVLTGCPEELAVPRQAELLLRKPASLQSIRAGISQVVGTCRPLPSPKVEPSLQEIPCHAAA